MQADFITCISFCSEGEYACLMSCNQDHKKNLTVCPCNEYCPLGCPCPNYTCTETKNSAGTTASSPTSSTDMVISASTNSLTTTTISPAFPTQIDSFTCSCNAGYTGQSSDQGPIRCFPYSEFRVRERYIVHKH